MLVKNAVGRVPACSKLDLARPKTWWDPDISETGGGPWSL